MILAGLARLGRDADLRYLPNGTPVAALALAFDYRSTKAGSQERPTQWVDASLFGERARALAPHLIKGTSLNVVIEDPHVEQYPRRDNTVGAALRGTVVLIDFAGKPPEKPANQTGTADPAPAPQPATAPAAPANPGTPDNPHHPAF